LFEYETDFTKYARPLAASELTGTGGENFVSFGQNAWASRFY